MKNRSGVRQRTAVEEVFEVVRPTAMKMKNGAVASIAPPATPSTGADLPAAVVADAALERLARLARGRVGADIERAVREARGQARREKRAMSYGDIADALVASRPRHPERLRRRIAVHEAGHALAHLLLFGTPPASATVDAPGGGLVETKIDLTTVEGVLSDVEAVLTYELSGYAAEAVVFGSTSLGAGGVEGSDLDLATRRAARLEGAHGWGSELPLIYHDDYALRRRLTEPAFARRVHARLEVALARARTLLADHREGLDRLVEALLREGSLEGNEISQAAGIEAAKNEEDRRKAVPGTTGDRDRRAGDLA